MPQALLHCTLSLGYALHNAKIGLASLLSGEPRPEWRQRPFHITLQDGGIRRCYGATYRGLGLHQIRLRSPERPPRFVISHLGTGLRIVSVECSLGEACLLTRMLAELGDWTGPTVTPELKRAFFAAVAIDRRFRRDHP